MTGAAVAPAGTEDAMTTTRDPIGFWSRTLAAAVLTAALAAATAQAQPAQSPPSSRVAAPTRPQTEAERRTVEALQAAQKEFDAGGARVMAASPGGRRRVAETIARQFGVPEKSVNDLRARRMTYGEVAIALSLSQHWMRRDKTLTVPRAVDRIVALRKSQDWAAVARGLDLFLGDVVGDLKKAQKQLAKLDTVKTARAEGQERKPPKADRPAR
jgi:hypothetical protein